MSKKEKKAISLTEEVVMPEADHAVVTSNSTETKAPAKKSKTTKTTKTVKSSAKKTVKAPKEAPETKVAVEITPVVENQEVKKVNVETPVGTPIEAPAQVYFQFSGIEISTQAIINQVKQIWFESSTEPIQSFDLYIKPEENAAYYVINTDITGKVEL